MKNKLIYFGTIWILFSCINTSPNETIFSDEQMTLLDKLQKQTIAYMWDGAEPKSGGARERYHSDDIYGVHPKNIVTSGGTGFGIMALIVGMERGFIDKQEGRDRLEKLLNWLKNADRFHGAWPHWFHPSGQVYPFSPDDDGGDLVETAFLAQGLISLRQYWENGNEQEKQIADLADTLWKGIDWQWYTKGGEEVLYWHWSPKYEWQKNFAVRGHNECMIMYFLGVCSPTHGIDPSLYHNGYMRAGKVYDDTELYGIRTIVNHYETNDMAVGPLFWSHYSFLGLDPRGLSDGRINWWDVTENHAKIHYEHCVRNPYDYRGYGANCWGLTSSYSMTGYAGHNPQEDLGVISPTAALSSFPYTPKESMQMLEYLYLEADSLVGEFGPYDAFSLESDWYVKRYLAIDQLPIPVMIENYRTGLLWDLFMSAPEVKDGMNKLKFIRKN